MSTQEGKADVGGSASVSECGTDASTATNRTANTPKRKTNSSVDRQSRKKSRSNSTPAADNDLTTVEGQLAGNPDLTFEDAKFQAKREYHRQNAARARVRNKQMVENLQEELAALSKRAESLERENEVLKAQLHVFLSRQPQQQQHQQSSLQAQNPLMAMLAQLTTMMQQAAAANPTQQDPNFMLQLTQLLLNQMQQQQQVAVAQPTPPNNFADVLGQLMVRSTQPQPPAPPSSNTAAHPVLGQMPNSPAGAPQDVNVALLAAFAQQQQQQQQAPQLSLQAQQQQQQEQYSTQEQHDQTAKQQQQADVSCGPPEKGLCPQGTAPGPQSQCSTSEPAALEAKGTPSVVSNSAATDTTAGSTVGDQPSLSSDVEATRQVPQQQQQGQQAPQQAQPEQQQQANVPQFLGQVPPQLLNNLLSSLAAANAGDVSSPNNPTSS